MIGKLFKRQSRNGDPIAAIPDGVRVYAIGDIHGRLDLLTELIAKIDADDAARAPAETHLVFLGDLIDRGPDSSGVIDYVMKLAACPTVRIILGNHEELFLAAIAGDANALRGFCRVGGRETAISYGIGPDHYERMTYDEVHAALREAVPAAHLTFLESFADRVELGDYLFVHAGINPAMSLEDQRPQDLRWIRDPFLKSDAWFGKVVVHGHTIRPEVEWRANRIGIDTGGYETGRLTALGLEGTERWTLQT